MNYFALFFCALLLSACTAPTLETEKAGSLMFLSGDYSMLGTEIQRGIELANDEAVEPYVLVVEDVGPLTPAKAVTPAMKLLNTDKVTVGLVADTQNAVVLGPIFSEKQVPLVVLWDSNNEIIGSGDYVFSSGFSAEKSAQGMAQYAYTVLQLKSIAIVKQQDPYSVVVADAFAKEFTALGGTILLNEEVGLDEKDFKTIILKIKSTKAQGVYFPIVPQSEVVFTKQMRDNAPDMTLLAADWFFQDTIKEAGAAAEGVYVHTIYTQYGDELLSKYREKYGKEPADLSVVDIGYAGMKKILEAKTNKDKSLQESLTEVFGQSRTLARTEKVFKVVDGKLVQQN